MERERGEGGGEREGEGGRERGRGGEKERGREREREGEESKCVCLSCPNRPGVTGGRQRKRLEKRVYVCFKGFNTVYHMRSVYVKKEERGNECNPV